MCCFIAVLKSKHHWLLSYNGYINRNRFGDNFVSNTQTPYVHVGQVETVC